MKSFKKYATAWVVTALVILGCIGFSAARNSYTAAEPAGTAETTQTAETVETASDLPDAAGYTWLVRDDADILSDETEETIARYNHLWDEEYSSYIAVVTVDNADDIEDYLSEVAEDMDLGSNDMILVMDPDAQDVYMDCGDAIWYEMDDDQITDYLNTYLYDDFMAGNYDEGVLSLLGAWNSWYENSYSSGYTGNYGYDYDYGYGYDYGYYGGGSMLGGLIAFVIIAVIILAAVDNARMRAYRRRYWGLGYAPPIPFRPILFWHRPGWGWYDRRWFGPGGYPGPGPMPGGPRPGGMPGGPRPGGMPGGMPGGPRPGGMGGPRPGGMSGGPRPGGSRPMGGGPRPGGMGGSRPMGGGPRGGGFGGHGGGFSGGHGGGHGGSFGGGHGGGFGGGHGGGRH